MNKNITISPYLFFLESKEKDFLVYNGLNNCFVKINKELFCILITAKDNINVLNELDENTLIALKKALIICTPEIIQKSISQKRFLKNYSAFLNDFLSLTIAPTSVCNFKCPYCFEKGITQKTMSDETINKLNEYIIERSQKTQKKIKITWYGGEPLLAIDKIKRILSGLKENGIDVIEQNIITNGYLLNEEKFIFLEEFGIGFVQITLDSANAKTHNARRFTKDNKGSWDIILENIDKIVSPDMKVHIAIRCNIDNSNKEDFYKLQSDLKKRWNNNPNILIYPAILRDHHNDNSSKCSYFSNLENSNYLIDEGVKNKNLSYFNYIIGNCSATQFNAYLIGTEGELYKCWHDLGREDKVVGTIHDKTNINKSVLLDYLSTFSMFEDENCKKCHLFFVCEGGCQWARINNERFGKDYNLCHFAKLNIEKYLESYYEIKQNQ